MSLELILTSILSNLDDQEFEQEIEEFSTLWEGRMVKLHSLAKDISDHFSAVVLIGAALAGATLLIKRH